MSIAMCPSCGRHMNLGECPVCLRGAAYDESFSSDYVPTPEEVAAERSREQDAATKLEASRIAHRQELERIMEARRKAPLDLPTLRDIEDKLKWAIADCREAHGAEVLLASIRAALSETKRMSSELFLAKRAAGDTILQRKA